MSHWAAEHDSAELPVCLDRRDGRGLCGHDGPGAPVPLRAHACQPVLPTPRHARRAHEEGVRARLTMWPHAVLGLPRVLGFQASGCYTHVSQFYPILARPSRA